MLLPQPALAYSHSSLSICPLYPGFLHTFSFILYLYIFLIATQLGLFLVFLPVVPSTPLIYILYAEGLQNGGLKLSIAFRKKMLELIFPNTEEMYITKFQYCFMYRVITALVLISYVRWSTHCPECLEGQMSMSVTLWLFLSRLLWSFEVYLCWVKWVYSF